MRKPTLTRADIVKALYSEIGLSHSESSELLEAIIHHMSSALLRGEDVKLTGFGKFSTRLKNERVGRNPKTGKAVMISERRVVVFRPSRKLQDRVIAGIDK